MNLEQTLLHIKLVAITSVLTVNAVICLTQILFTILKKDATVNDDMNKKM